VILLLFAAMSMAMAKPLPVTDASCRLGEAERAAMTAAAYEAFDQSMDGRANWRAVMNRGCYETAAGLIEAYIAQNAAQLTGEQRRTLSFHAGQVLAFGGRETLAAPYFAAARGGDAEWNTYVESQLAFVRRDRTGFEAARSAYARIAPNSVRRGFLDSQSACFEKPFTEALACEAAKP
jgi:hypothetical protein